MPDAPPITYARLPGSGLSRKGAAFISVARITCRLWLGDDHLLQVEAAGGYSETYKRFYFRDIQAIIIQKTKTWFVANTVLGVLTGLFLLWGISVHDEGGRIFLGFMTGLLGLFLLVSLLRGPSCVCFLKTAVHMEELPSLRRRRNAERVLARIKPLIEAAQGPLPPETLTPQYDSLLANAKVVPAAPGQFVRMADPEMQTYRSRVHKILYCTLLADAVSTLINLFLPSLPVVLLNTLLGALVSGALIIALVKQYQTDLKPAVRLLTWLAAAYVVVGYLASFVVMMTVIPSHGFDGTQWGYLKGLAELKPFETPWWLGVLLVNTVLSGIFGAAGLLLLREHWRQKQSAA
jgi:hypothetical protein